MGTELPPSKFGAGYTYGGTAEPEQSAFAPAATPQGFYPPPATQPAPAASSSPDAAATPQGFYTAPAPQPSAFGHAQQTNANAPGYPPATQMKQQYAGSGGTAITAAVLSFIGVLYNGTQAAFGVMSLVGLGMMSSNGYRNDGTVVLAAVLDILMIIGPILLLVGGIQLLRHRLSGRRMIVAGCTLTILGQLVWGLVLFGIIRIGSGLAGSLGTATTSSIAASWNSYATTALLMNLAPAIGAVVTIAFALAPATRRWCEPVHPAPAPRGVWGPAT